MNSTKHSDLTRRDFIKFSAAGIAAVRAAQPFVSLDQAAASPKGSIPIGLQLYSVRRECAKDLPGTIAAVAKMDYKGVEFAGYYDRAAKELRKMLDDHGLKCCGTHIGLDTLLGDNLAKTIEFNGTLGNKFLIAPGLPDERTKSRETWLETARLFNELAEKVRSYGMRVGYHNHTIEFKPIEGELPWDIFFGNTRKDVVMQIDIGNAMDGGADPISFIKRYPGRAGTAHVKEFSKKNPKALVGEGDVDWKQVFGLLEKQGGTEWYIVEYEIEGMPPLDCVASCLKNLQKMGK